MVHRGEPFSSGIFIITSGSATTLSPPQGKCRPRRTNIIFVPPFCIGHLNVLAEEPQEATIKAITKCDVWCVSSQVYFDALQCIPKDVYERTIANGFRPVNERFRSMFSVSPAFLRQFVAFSRCPEPVLDELCRQMQPECLPKHHILQKIGGEATHMVLVLKGKCCVKKLVNGVLVECGVVVGPVVLSDSEVVSNVKHTRQVETISRVDCFYISATHFHAAVRVAPDVLDGVHAALRSAREKEIETGRDAYRSLLKNIPLLSAVADSDTVSRITNNFVARVYKPMSVMCSTATYCDRLILVLRGRVSVDDCSNWPIGEFGGYSGVMRHRWARSVIAQDPVETFELSMDKYVAFLKEASLLQDVREMACTLMFPKAYPPEIAVKTLALLSGHKCPHLFPVSHARKVTEDTSGHAPKIDGNKPCPSPCVQNFRDMTRISSTTWLRRFK